MDAYRLLDAVNRRLGGYRLTAKVFDALLPETERPIEIVDVAGGNGDFARRMTRWAREAGRPVRATVVDTSPVGLAGARLAEPVGAVQGDARALPLRDRSIDVAHSSCFFHHLSTADARDALAEMCRISRRLVVVNDLVRSRIAAGSIWLLTRLLVENRLVRADGPLSVRKSFVPEELVEIAQSVGLSGEPGFRWTLARGFPYRMALVGVRLAGRRIRA